MECLLKLLNVSKKPPLFEPSTSQFWDDEHISKGMLAAHLNPTVEAASRTHEFIDRSVEWITQIAPPSKNKKLLDLGCGPGLYAERLCKKGYDVTGIDFSKRSIDYAKASAEEKNYNIAYSYQNYLTIDYENKYDVVILIYCDFVVLSDDDRALLLKKIHLALKPGGKLIFDVFTHKGFENKEESQTWALNEDGGFWKPNKYLCLQSHWIYEEDIRLDQYIIIDQQENIDVIRNWFKPYKPKAIIEEVKKAGFGAIDLYSDVTGQPYVEDSETIALVVKK